MTFGERFGAALRDVPEVLEPAEGLSDDALAAARRGRRRRLAGIVALAAGILVGIPLAVTGIGSGPETAPPGDTGGRSAAAWTPSTALFPRPGGGSAAIHLLATGTSTYILDEAAGEYYAFPYGEAALSPDRRSVAVIGADGRLGIADRDLLLRDGDDAVVWTGVTGGGPQWSPDGRAVVVTDVDKAGGATRIVAWGHDVASGTTQRTVVPMEIIGQVGWAPDSERYLVLSRGEEGTDTVEPGALRYVNRNGSLGPAIGVEGGTVVGYSPSGELLLVDDWLVQSAGLLPSKVIDVGAGEVVREFEGRAIGWYDEEHFIRAVDDALQVVPVAGGAPVRSFPSGALDFEGSFRVDVGPAGALPETAADLGF